jgi:hypothetical protein
MSISRERERERERKERMREREKEQNEILVKYIVVFIVVWTYLTSIQIFFYFIPFQFVINSSNRLNLL